MSISKRVFPAFAGCVFACSYAEAKVPAPIQKMQQSGVEVVESFAATQAAGYTGWVVRKGETVRFFYTTPDGKYLIAGNIFDKEGRNISADDVKRATDTAHKVVGVQGSRAATALPTQSKPDPSLAPQDAASQARLQEYLKQLEVVRSGAPSVPVAVPAQAAAAAQAPNGGPTIGTEQLYKMAESSTWIQDGKGSRVVYVIFDPNCGYCHAFYSLVKSIDRSVTQIRWIPVVAVSPESPAHNAWILSSRDRLGAFQSAMEGRAQKGNMTPELKSKLVSNYQILRQSGSTGVPTFIWKEAGGRVVVSQGTPEEATLKRLFVFKQ